MKNSSQIIIALLASALVLLLAAIWAASLGFMRIPFHQVATIAWMKLAHQPLTSGMDPTAVSVVAEVRLPRIAAAILIGGILAVSGAVFQALLLNPLADSYTLGISTGAAFGASLVIVLQILGVALPSFISVPIFAFLGALATLVVVLFLAAEDRRLSSINLILAGVIVSAILSAAIGFFKFLADEQVGIIIFWLMGSLAGITWPQIMLLAPVAVGGVIVLSAYGRDLNIMAAGDRTASSLGLRTSRLRILLLSLCSLMTSMAVAVAGVIGFIGLIVPHLLRHFTGPDNRLLIPFSFFAGALLLLVADTLTRSVLPAEVPIGVLTALLGGPFFCFLFKRRSRNVAASF